MSKHNDSSSPDDELVTVDRWQHGRLTTQQEQVADECAVAMVYNGISHAVMMATPNDLENFAIGFSISEGIVDAVQDIYDFVVTPQAKGIELQMNIAAEKLHKLKLHRKNLSGRTGCGLCGAESLEYAIRAAKPLTGCTEVSHQAIQRAREQFHECQPLQAATGGMHGAAWCTNNGDVALLCEDVGRHNALDKLVGLFLRSDYDARHGFIVISSRISYEMVIKASAMDCNVLVAVSAPTGLAIELAQQAGMTLVGFTRPERHSIYSHPQQIING